VLDPERSRVPDAVPVTTLLVREDETVPVHEADEEGEVLPLPDEVMATVKLPSLCEEVGAFEGDVLPVGVDVEETALEEEAVLRSEGDAVSFEERDGEGDAVSVGKSVDALTEKLPEGKGENVADRVREDVRLEIDVEALTVTDLSIDVDLVAENVLAVGLSDSDAYVVEESV
jgi:hypothetical protein